MHFSIRKVIFIYNCAIHYILIKNFKSLKFFSTCILGFFLIFGKILAQELPPVLNYLPTQYGAANQNWAISQDAAGHMYFANNEGLLSYNGGQWQLYDSPNSTILRSVMAVGDRIYTGCFMEFGFWKRNSKGLLKYESLSQNMPITLVEDEQFWNIYSLDHWVLFQSLNRIYIYDTEESKFNVIDIDKELTKAFVLDNTIYFQAIDAGLYRLQNGVPELLIADELLHGSQIVHVFKKEEQLVLITQDNGFFKYTNERLEPWQLPVDDFLVGNSIYSAKTLSNGTVVLGTISNGIYQIDTDGHVLMGVNQEKGLANNTVLSLFEDLDKNIWLGLDNGISVLNSDSAFRVYQDTAGKLGTVYTAVSVNGNLYLGTNQGLFVKNQNNNEGFNLVKGTNGQVWSLKAIGGNLFCGHNLGTFLIQGNEAHLISSIPGAWDFKLVKGKSDLVLQGTYNGLYVLKKENDTWQVSHKLTGFDISSRFFEMPSSHVILVSHEYKGVFKLEVNDEFTQIKKFEMMTSAPAGQNAGLVNYKDQVLYCYDEGVLGYDITDQTFKINKPLTEGLNIDSSYSSGKLIVDDNDKLWGFTKDGLVYFTPRNLDNSLGSNEISFPFQVRQVMEGYENITHLSENKYLIGFAGGYTILDLSKFHERTYRIAFSTIENRDRDEISQYVNYKDQGEIKKFKAKENNLKFTYNITNYEKYELISFQYRLKGIYDQWSSWRAQPEVFFENLPFGDYNFEVRGKVGNIITSNTANYNFTIARPWYISIPAICIYGLSLISALMLVHYYTRRYYKIQKQKLLEKTHRELELAKYENEGKIMKLRNEKLQDDIKSKSRELAASTMSIVKTNEFLDSIKKDLMPVKEIEDVKRVIRTIDKNLNNLKDWKFFEEAFNNADKDFLQKMKHLHPALTPNDLKLCAYLRLNLSSKEIAPLLNISVRSVEIKRYRLRKKIEIPHENSLVEYILSI